MSGKSRINNFKQLLRFKKPILNPTRRRLSKAFTIYDLRLIAKRRTPIGPFDYTDGAANQEISLNRARRAFEDIEFQPRILRDVSSADLSTNLFDRKMKIPLGIAPTGFTRMMQTEGEIAGVTTAFKYGAPFCLSTMGTTSIEAVASSAPDASKWFQLYLWRDREQSLKFIEEAKAAGFEGLMLTVDTAIGGIKWRDMRNGLTVPPKIGLKTFLDMALKPKWWFNLLTTAPLEIATCRNFNKPLSEIAAKVFDPSVTFEDVKWLRSVWKGKLIIKGIQTVSDAQELSKLGVDAIVLSNHGGRQLDRSVVPLELLPLVREVIGVKGSGPQIYVDGAIMSGADCLAAIALGADAVLIGRAYLYGAMAGGKNGVQKVVDILRFEMETAMKLMGAKNLTELSPEFINIRN